MAEQLYSLARDFAGLTGDENVFDLYCGTGTIGLALAPDARFVWGLEIAEEAVRGLRDRECRAQRDRECQFYAGNVGQPSRSSPRKPAWLMSSSWPTRARGLPARRSGARELSPLDGSCMSRAIRDAASDVQVLRDDHGYELVRCRPVDMCPHTPHVESVSLLKRTS